MHTFILILFTRAKIWIQYKHPEQTSEKKCDTNTQWNTTQLLEKLRSGFMLKQGLNQSCHVKHLEGDRQMPGAVVCELRRNNSGNSVRWE